MPDKTFIDAYFRFLSEERDGAVAALDSEEFRFLSFAANFLRLSRSQILQDLWVLYELQSKRSGYFVEFGAADGVLLSNTAMLERHFGWDGALSEPNPAWHDALRKNRNVFMSRRCIAGQSNGRVAFNCAPIPELSTIDSYSAEDMHAEARRGGAIVEVETQSLADFLAAAAAPRRIDYLSIDTEGSEYEILSRFDFSRYEIALITVEHNYTENRHRLWDLLTGLGYRRKFERFSQFDDWYLRDSAA